MRAARRTRIFGRQVGWTAAGAGLVVATGLAGAPAPPLTTGWASAQAATVIGPRLHGTASSPRARSTASNAGPAATSALGTPWISTNWSGYAVTGSGIDAVTGSWVVPSVAPSPVPAYSATWVGIDGFAAADPSLIQAGTEQDAPGFYSAWWSTTYFEQHITEPVGPGDAMSVDIHRVAGDTWAISVRDATRRWTFAQDVAYGGPGGSAEWVVEAPSVGGFPSTLAQFSPTTFDLASVDGANPLLLPLEAGVMLPAGAALPAAVPSLPDVDTDGFTVSAGFVPPLPPTTS